MIVRMLGEELKIESYKDCDCVNDESYFVNCEVWK